jgi:eukaryotic-like serine/threonine-protein kinase
VNPLEAGPTPADGQAVAPDDPRVIAAVEEYLTALEAGRPPNRRDFLARHALIAAPLADCLAGLDVVHSCTPRLLPAGRRSLDGEAERLAEALAEGPLGDYRIVREVGRGGMGVVFEAEQLSLGRRVALKVLPFAAALDAKHLQRFKNEAHAAAQLRHEHIVPVHAVGCERGIHFYAMQYIDGWPLSTVLRELRRRAGREIAAGLAETEPEPAARTSKTGSVSGEPAVYTTTGVWLPAASVRESEYFRAVALLGIQAAEALEHAHQLGVVHRDVKPANLLVDGRGHLWVADFGLARFPTDTSVTLTGDVVGTLRYMSPEQALGDPRLVDFRTDLYSLGATLYELLTLRPASDGRDRQELLRQLADREPVPPRRHNPAVPVELQTIVLKALAKNPAERYGTAQELADDLQRFLDDRPIHARPPTPGQRLRRWARRHRALVASSASLLLLLLVGLALGTGLLLQERGRTRAALDQANANLEEARRQRQQAREAVNEMYSQFAEKWLDQAPRLEGVQLQFLLKALHYYQAFAREEGQEPAERLETARASSRVGDIQSRLGKYREAEAAYDEAARLLQPLVREFPAERGYRHELARCYHHRANLLKDLGRLDAAEAGYRASADLLRQLQREEPANRAFLLDLFASQDSLGPLLSQRGRPDEAEKLYLEGVTRFERLVQGHPDDAGLRCRLGLELLNWGNALREQGKFAEAEKALRRCVALEQALVRESPKNVDYRQFLGAGLNNLGLVFKQAQRLKEAEVPLRQALELFERLAEDFPAVPDRACEVASCQANLGTVLGRLDRPDEAAAVLGRAVAGFRKLTAAFPAAALYRRDLTAALLNLGAVQAVRGQVAEAERTYREALRQNEELAKAYPNEPEFRHGAARCHNNLGELFRQNGRPAEAEPAYRAALKMYEELTARYPAMAEYRSELAGCWKNLGRLFQANDREKEAEEAFARAERLCEAEKR